MKTHIQKSFHCFSFTKQHTPMTLKTLKQRLSATIKTTCLLFVLIAAQTNLKAQVSAYSFSQLAGTYTAITGTAVTNMNAGSAWDDAATLVPIGFSFTFNGTAYSSVTVNSNGYIIFGTAGLNAIYTPISTINGSGVVAAFARDQNAQATAPLGNVQYSSTGGVFTVQWSDAKRYTTATTAERLFYQIKLYQTTNVVEVIYGAFTNAVLVSTVYPQVGLRGSVVTDFNNRTVATGGSWAASTAGGANTATCFYGSTSVATKPASGQIYRWTPPSCIAPGGLTASGITLTSANVSWTAASPAPTSGYQYYLSTVNTAPNGATTPTGSTAAGVTSVALTGLTANTTYYIWVRSNCGGTQSGWSSVLVFTTGYCVPTGSTTYYLSNVVTTNGVTNISNATGAGAGGYSNYSATISCSNYLTNPTNITLTPAITTDYFYCWIDWNNDLDFLDANETIFATTTYSASYTGVINIPAATPNGNYIMRVANSFSGVIASSCGPATNGEFEDYTFTVVSAPSCVAPTALTSSSITASSANISWTAASPAPTSGYQYYLSTTNTAPNGATIPTGSTAAGTTSVALTGLTANTTYYIWVRSNCGSGNTSAWTSVLSFYTGYCQPVGSTTYYMSNVVTANGVTNISNATGAGAGGYSNYSASISCSNYTYAATNITLTPAITTDYFYCWIDWNNDLDFLDANETIFATTTYSASYTGVITIPASTANGNYRMRVANSYIGAITQCGPATYGEYEDYTFTVIPDPVITTPPPCIAAPTAPTNGATGISITPTLSWATNTITTGYTVLFGTTNPPTTTVSVNQTGLTYVPATLLNSTAYYWQVIPSNSLGSASGCSVWSFTTAQAGCANASAYATVTAPTDNTPLTISTLQYQIEYSTINSVVAGNVYVSSYSLGGYITVHQGTPAGPIIAYGATPLTWTATVAGTYYVHYNTTAYPACGTASSAGTSVITCTSCPPPPINYLAQIQSVNFGSSDWCAGETRTVTVTVKNNGVQTWTNAAPDINIGIKWNTNGTNWADYYVRTDANGLAPGAIGTYSLVITASNATNGPAYTTPLSVGLNNLIVDLVSEQNFWFADNINGGGPGNVKYTSPAISINSYPTITAPTNTSVCIALTTPLTATVPTITKTFLSESFSGSSAPGWSVTTTGSAWTSATNPITINASANAGGAANEVMFYYNGSTATNRCVLYYGPINTTGYTSLNLSFKQYLSTCCAGTYPYTIAVKTGNNATGWGAGAPTVWSSVNPAANITANTTTMSISNANVGSSTFYLAFIVDGMTYGLNGWYIDDVVLTAPVTPTVTWAATTGLYTDNAATTAYTGTNTYTVYSSPPSSQTYTATANSLGCNTTSTVSVTLNTPTIATTMASGDLVWNGRVSTDYTNLNNWYGYSGTTYTNAAAAPTSANNIVIPVTQNCIINQPNTGTNTVAAKKISIETGATLTMGAGVFNVAGQWFNNGSFTPSTGKVVFNGSGSQNIVRNNGTATEVFYDVEVSKSAGAITINNPVEIINSTTFTNGLINSTATNLYIFRDGATAIGANSRSFVNGPVQKIGTQAFTFPIGKGVEYAPASITAPSTNTDKFTAEYFAADPDLSGYSNLTRDPTIDHISYCEYWMIDRTNGNSSPKVTLSWGSTRSCGVTFMPDLLVSHWDAGTSTWQDLGNGGTTGSTTNGDVTTLNNVNSFSPFALASLSRNNPLPIELTDFTATCSNSKVYVNWNTATELNNQYYTLERSGDGVHFEPITYVNGHGTTVSANHYSYIDEAPLSGISYYRLKQTDFNGTSKTFRIESVSCDKSNDISIYPNPNKGSFVVNGTSAGAELIVTDIVGKVILQTITTAEQTSVDLTKFSTGIYYITVKQNGINTTKKVAIN